MRSCVFIICLFVFAACTDSEKVPKGILPMEKMESVLWDMMLADRYSAQFLLKDSATRDVKKETFQMYSQVFQLHNITRDQFITSYKYYLNRPDLGKVMFDSLGVRGSRNRDTLYKKMQELQKKPD
jgi:hypothetical protein